MAKRALSPWQRKPEDMATVREEKRLAVLKAGAAAFRERGFEKTSLDDIAGKLGVTKPTLYYYISDKQDIVYACSSLANGELMALARSQDPKRPGLESLEDFFRRYAELIASDFGYCLTMINENLLPATRVKELRRNKRELNSVVIAMLERGIADGSVASCDTRLVSFALFGAFNWVARWHSGSSATTDRIAEVFMSLFSNGIAAHRR